MVSFTLFVAFSIGTALSPNIIAALIVLRVLQGGSSASVQAVGAGTIADYLFLKNVDKLWDYIIWALWQDRFGPNFGWSCISSGVEELLNGY